MQDNSGDVKDLLLTIKRDLLDRMRLLEEYFEVLDANISRLRIDFQKLNNKVEELLGRAPTWPQPPTPAKATARIRAKLGAEAARKKRSQEGLSQTEVMILKYLAENPGTKSATPIASAIGKAREHVARTLRKLSEQGYVIRDENTWPYAYMLSEEAKKVLSSHLT